MNHLFIPYNLALKAKELGFDEPVFAVIYPDGEVVDQFYSKPKLSSKEEFCVAAPLYQQVIDWLREKHSTHIEPITKVTNEFGYTATTYRVLMIKSFKEKVGYGMRDFTMGTLPEAIEQAFKLLTK